MTIAHAATEATVQEELDGVEAEEAALEQELLDAHRAVAEARQAGAAVLGAVEAAMAPLMADLAAARRESEDPAGGENPPATRADLEAEIKHLQLDISHYQNQAERLQIEERQRSHEVKRLRTQLSEASENLVYEQERVRHYELCRQLGAEDGSWAGVSPSGIGRRTMEVRAEQKLRELAELRQGKLSRDFTKLASNTSLQQLTIEQLGNRLEAARRLLQLKDKSVKRATTRTAAMYSRLKGEGGSVVLLAPDSPACRTHMRDTDRPQEADGEAKAAGGKGKGARALGHSKQPRGASSTGKLPQLSF